MSTRSGKRIHGSFQENTINIDTEVPIESDRKIRKRKLKENCDIIDKTLLKSNKRNNYVTYPTDDEDQSGCLTQEKPLEEKRIRKILRSTLKDQNIQDYTLLSDLDQDVIAKKTRSTRRTKKLSDETLNEQNIVENSIAKVQKMITKKISNGEANKSYEIVAEASVSVSKKPKDKKKKKSKSPVSKNNVEIGTVSVTEKKKLKKKKKVKRYTLSDNNTVEINNMKNGSVIKSNLPTDSFHSAAGSPIEDSANKVTVTVSTKCPKYDIILQEERSIIKNETYDKMETSKNQLKFNSTYDKSSKEINTIYDKDDKMIASDHNDATSDTNKGDSKTKPFDIENKQLNTTFNKNDSGIPNRKSSNVATPTLENIIKSFDSTFDKDLNITVNDNIINTKVPLINDSANTTNNFNSTFDKKPKLDATFEKSEAIKNSISPLVSSDATNSTINVTLDKSVTSTPINITSDDSNTEHILNATPVMVDSSTNESHISNSKMTPDQSVTPLKREGTFTKDPSDEKLRIYKENTPTKRMSLPSPGCTPFFVKTVQNDKFSVNHYNDIKSAEKSRRSSAFNVELPSRATKVMFCSPVNNPVAQTERKNKIVKSSMKGSNKSFVLMENALVPAAGRKRSLSLAPGCADDAGAKRRRRDQRARTDTSEARTPTGKAAKGAPISGAARRTALPNFAALHARNFGQMESLSEFKERRARRARLLLTPTAPTAPTAPTITPAPTAQIAPIRAAPRTPDALPKNTLNKMESENKKLPTLESLRPGYTRFGFKMNVETNPFNVSDKSESKVKQNMPKNTMKRQPILPSLAGVTSSWKDIAKNSVMREKSSTSLTERRDGKRKEYRTIIKGVRTNRRFELQMKSRNING